MSIEPPILNSADSYRQWKATMKFYLKEKQVMDIVNGTKPKPNSVDSNESEISTWVKMDNLASLILSKSIGSKYFFLVTDHEEEGSNIIWKSVTNHFEAKNAAAKIISMKQLVQIVRAAEKHYFFIFSVIQIKYNLSDRL